MSFLYRNCPCCGAKINKLSFFSQKVYNSVNCELNYKCFHCPTCKNKISKQRHLLFTSVLGIFLAIMTIVLADITIENTAFYPEKMSGFFWMLFWIFYLLLSTIIATYFVATFTSLKCTKLTPNEYDNQPDSNILFKGKNGINLGEFDDNVRIDPLERKVMFNMAMFPTYMFLLTMLVLVVYIIYDNVFN